ncbi:MAG: tRNA (guanosine(37)-N1)-methyltransferase TrmD, partial [Eubacterium sp.]
MKYYFLTLFPDIFHHYFGDSMMKRAIEKGILDYEVIDIRDYSGNKHNRVDDYPYGGGAGMVMAAPPIINALRSIEHYE